VQCLSVLHRASGLKLTNVHTYSKPSTPARFRLSAPSGGAVPASSTAAFGRLSTCQCPQHPRLRNPTDARRLSAGYDGSRSWVLNPPGAARSKQATSRTSSPDQRASSWHGQKRCPGYWDSSRPRCLPTRARGSIACILTTKCDSVKRQRRPREAPGAWTWITACGPGLESGSTCGR
jgi:hypothetical protein